ncbi:MAG: glycosyl transferase family 2 [Verrucomicrobia bacterium]|nr:MAG: glycosyl transferase family 2 [Verrucomicrobiota bacterium]
MNENLPTVTVLIAARPGQAEVKAVAAARGLDYPADKLDILVARGRQPSAQRNAAMKAAQGEWIYFLDDDSVPRPDNLRRATSYLSDPEVKMVGGPNLCPPDAPGLEQVFALVLASRLAFGPSRARYWPVGKARAASEKELILCNLMARRDAMLELGGFNEALYPNEENALMDELQKRGGKLIYDPEFTVLRRPRPGLKSFVRMLLTYGRGRGEQFRLHPTFGSALNFVPPLFVVYLLSLLSYSGARLFVPGTPHVAKLLVAPLCFYLLAVLVQGVALASSGKLLYSIAAMPLIVLTHVLYGCGVWRGMFTSLRPAEARPKVEVVVERIPVQSPKSKVQSPESGGHSPLDV